MTDPRQTLVPDDLLLSVAQSRARQESTAPSTDVVELVIALDALGRAIVEHNRRLLVGEPVDWDALTDQLGDVERACRRLLSPEPTGGAQPAVTGTRSRASVTRRPVERPNTGPIYG